MKKVKEPQFIQDLDDEKYLLALGRFIANFAAVEGVLNETVWYFAKLTKEPQIAKAIFSALRVDAACQHLTRLVEARKLKGIDIPYLAEIIEHLGKIAQTRNAIVHLGASKWGDGPFVVSNKKFVHSASRTKTTYVSPETLDKISGDLLTIFGRLTVLARAIAPGYKYSDVRAGFGMNEPLPTAWLYEPRVQSARRRKRRGKIPKRQTQRQSSGE